MYYKSQNCKPYQSPTAEMIEKHGLVKIEKTEFDGIVTSINTPTASDKIRAIDRQLREIDLQRGRPLAELALASTPQEVKDYAMEKLATLETEAQTLRDERATLV